MTQCHLRRARRANRHFIHSLLLIPVLAWALNTNAETIAPSATESSLACSGVPAVEANGQRKLALLVGVGDYKNRRVPDLSGPVNDVSRIRELLTTAEGFRFPQRNVCVLKNQQATTAGFKETFRKALIDRAQPGDTVVIFFAGHGSQTRDTGGDEIDGWDETLMFHDSRVKGVRDFRDDELHELLAELHQKTQDITLILDACSSGTSMRATSRYTARFVPPQEHSAPEPTIRGLTKSIEAAGALPGLVTMSAAADGKPAVERDGNGIFTSALLSVLKSAQKSPLLYQDLARLVPLRMASLGNQVPVFNGPLDRSVFSTPMRVSARGDAGVKPPEALRVSVRGTDIESVNLAKQRGALRVALLENGPRDFGSETRTRENIEIVDRDEDLEVRIVKDNRIEIRSPDNTILNVLTAIDDAVEALKRHARLWQLKATRGTNADFSDQESLRVRLLPATDQPKCASGVWSQARFNDTQVIPLCHNWQVEISLEKDAPSALDVHAIVSSADGSLFTLPSADDVIRLEPGDRHVFKKNATFRGLPPLDSNDRVYVLGREPGVTSSIATVSSIVTRVEANSGFEDRLLGPIKPREYTIEKFDPRPYLPANPEAPLHRVLSKAHEMTLTSQDDGLPYRQHDWSKASDAENLNVGIDCSRAIWFAFTRVGLPYNEGDRYLHTAAMIGDDTPMRDEFDLCPDNAPYELGDVLVYRSDDRGDGHTVMVIDPDKRIAWGSHGWDGNPKASGGMVPPDEGVEYQRIKFKPDWARWDRRDMTLRACWRYRKFSAINETNSSDAVSVQSNLCTSDRCLLRSPDSVFQE